jgi:hypothetical protein
LATAANRAAAPEPLILVSHDEIDVHYLLKQISDCQEQCFFLEQLKFAAPAEEARAGQAKQNHGG